MQHPNRRPLAGQPPPHPLIPASRARSSRTGPDRSSGPRCPPSRWPCCWHGGAWQPTKSRPFAPSPPPHLLARRSETRASCQRRIPGPQGKAHSFLRVSHHIEDLGPRQQLSFLQHAPGLPMILQTSLTTEARVPATEILPLVPLVSPGGHLGRDVGFEHPRARQSLQSPDLVGWFAWISGAARRNRLCDNKIKIRSGKPITNSSPK